MKKIFIWRSYIDIQKYEIKIHDDVIKWKHFPRCWPFVRGFHRWPVNSPHKGQWRGALMFSLICSWINGWVNNREAGDLIRHRAHYDITAMRPTNSETFLFHISACIIKSCEECHRDGKSCKTCNKGFYFGFNQCRGMMLLHSVVWHVGPFLVITLINFNSSMDKYLRPLLSVGVELFIHSRTLTVKPLMFENWWIISPNTLMGMWLLIHAGI